MERFPSSGQGLEGVKNEKSFCLAGAVSPALGLISRSHPGFSAPPRQGVGGKVRLGEGGQAMGLRSQSWEEMTLPRSINAF